MTTRLLCEFGFLFRFLVIGVGFMLAASADERGHTLVHWILYTPTCVYFGCLLARLQRSEREKAMAP